MKPKAAAALAPFLETVYNQYHSPHFLGSDPLALAHQFHDAADREIAALFCALLAYGNVKQIQRSLTSLFTRMDNQPGRFVREFDPTLARQQLRGFKHRFSDEDDILCLCQLLHHVMATQTLEQAFLSGVRPGDTDFSGAAGRFVALLYAQPFPSPLTREEMLARSSFKHLFPRADKGSACKRVHLFLRWMVRPNDGIDLNLWQAACPSMLLMPVDTHVLRIAQNLGLTSAKTADAKAALAITTVLRQIDPNDPVRFDFSLCRLGILGACPKKSEALLCRECALYDPCKRRRKLFPSISLPASG